MLAATLGAVALTVGTPPAAAKAPCWRQIINDWLDNERIDDVYPLRCYGEAIRHIPNDLRQYSSIVEDITSARQQLVRSQNNPTPPPPTRVLQSRKQTGTNGATGPLRNPPKSAPKAAEPDSGLFKETFNAVGPRNADSVPLPLMILAGLALLLIAAGAAGIVSKRFRARRSHAP